MIRRFILIVTGLVAAGFSLPSAYLNAASTFHGEASVLAGVVSVAVVVFGMAIGPDVVAAFKRQDSFRALLGVPIWVFCFAFTLVNSISFASGNRGDVVVTKGEEIAQHQRANADIAQLNTDLEFARRSDMWTATAACTAVTRRSKGFCDHVQEIKAGIQRASAVVVTAAPATADAQADFLSWMSGISPQIVSRVMPAWLVICAELVAMSSFIFATAQDSTVPAKKLRPKKRKVAPKRPRSGAPALRVVN